MRSARVTLLVLSVLFPAVPLLGQMDATMSRGETRTLTAILNYTGQTFNVNTPLIVVINASPELTLGKTTLPSFNCTETPNVNTCRGGTVAIGPQTVTFTQVITVRNDASNSPATWTAQLVGDGLSGASPKTGVITIPDARARIILTNPPQGMVESESEPRSARDSMTFRNVGNASGPIGFPAVVDPRTIARVPEPDHILSPGGRHYPRKHLPAGLLWQHYSCIWIRR